MLIADILAPRHNNSDRKGLHAAVNATGNTITAIETVAPSFAISMQLAGALKKSRFDAVIVHTNRQAIAAISAKIIAEKNNAGYAIVYQPVRCEDTPHNIPPEVIEKVSLWIFEDEIQKKQYAHLGVPEERSKILPPTSFDAENIGPITPAKYAGHTALNLLWIGEITDYQLLRNAVDAIRQLPETAISFTICGTGKARCIMPIVRDTRADKGHTYIWRGNEYEIRQELGKAHILIAEKTYFTATQIECMRCGLPVYQAIGTSTLRDNLAAIAADPEVLRAARQGTRQAYQDTYNPLFHVKQFIEFIAEATK